MKKSWGMIPMILSGEKTIESRWYQTKRAPWGKIKAGEIIYFKNSGEPVTAKAKISKVIEFENLTPGKIKEILSKYGKQICIEEVPLDKKYGILIFLKDPKKVKPFWISKEGFGQMTSWMTLSSLQPFQSF
jgi:ASC-1-like (ASCH) protein